MEWLSTKIDNVLSWIKQFFLDIWHGVADWVYDFVVKVFGEVLDAIYALLSALPVPDFIAAASLQNFLSGIDPAVLYFLSRSGFGPAIALIGAGVAFRLLRKLFTLGQW